MAEVYKIICLVTKKFYVGVTTKTMDERWREHISHARNANHPMLIVRAIRKYGPKKFKLVLLGRYYSIERALEKEKHFIKLASCRHPVGYNLTDGGDGVFGLEWTPAQRERQRQRMLGKPGTKWTLQQRAKMAVINAGNPNLDQTGRVKTAEHRAKLSVSLKGYRQPLQQRAAVAAANQRRRGMKYRKRLGKLVK